MIEKNKIFRKIPDSNQNNMSQSKHNNVRKLFEKEHYQSNMFIVIRHFFVNSINTSNFINQAMGFLIPVKLHWLLCLGLPLGKTMVTYVAKFGLILIIFPGQRWGFICISHNFIHVMTSHNLTLRIWNSSLLYLRSRISGQK